MNASRLGVAFTLLLLAVLWLTSPTGAQQMTMLGLWGTSGPGVAGTPVVNQMPLAVTLTARNVAGALFAEKSSRWSVTSAPAVSNQATASIAAEASVRHVVDCIAFSAVSGGTAAAATVMTVNVRDGASGAGTVIWTYASGPFLTPAINTSFMHPVSFCGLNLPGTTNTAMTLEFSALLTNLLESVSISGYNVGS